MKALRQLLKDKNISIALFCTLNENYDRNMYYFSKYKGLGCLVVPKNKQPFLLVPLMEYERARKSSKVGVTKWEKGEKLFEILNKILKRKNIMPDAIGLCFDDISISLQISLKKYIKKVKLKDISKDCIKIREIKDNEEIGKIRKSCRIADSILKKCIKNMDAFRTEKDVEIFLHTETIKEGCTLAFPPIIASGSSSSMPHYQPGNTKLKKGFCVIDFGVVYEGYHSDITRTVYIGTPKEEEKKVYNLLLKTQKELISKIKVDKRCSKLYEATLKLLKGYADNFTHGLGHGLGLQIHELPNLTSKSEDRFRNNAVFTVEPGIYFENRFGIRIEDDILIKNNKVQVLTKTPKSLIAIQR